MVDISASVLRYWEKEFKQLRPIKNAKGERRYMQRDIDVIKKIHGLLKEKGFTIEGAKKELLNEGTLFVHTNTYDDKNEIIQKIENIKSLLMKLKH
jgi:DNA-binding transcriptional MerR regulator